MAEKKSNIGRQALDEENLENVSGGRIYREGNKWVAHQDAFHGAWGGAMPPPKGYHAVFDTREEAVAFEKEQNNPNGWGISSTLVEVK